MQGKLQKETPQLVFAHRTAKLVFKFYPTETGYTNKIVYDGLTGVENDAKEVIFNPSNEVLLAPQTLPAGKAVLRVLMNGHWINFGIVSPDQDVELKAGVSHIFKVEVDEIEGVSITYQGDAAWDCTEVPLSGDSPELTPGDVDGEWNKDKESNLEGESTELTSGGKGEVGWDENEFQLEGTPEE